MTLYNIHRPDSFVGVVGQDAAIKSLKGVLNRDDAHTFLFIGPSGTGKTTLARLAAKYLRCEPNDILEVAAAKFTGVDNMREIQDAMQYRPLGGECRAVILDECHALSKNAWQSLLKATEEPPKHLYWFLCTTEASKVPETIKTRAAIFKLKEVGEPQMRGLIEDVCKKEKIDLSPDTMPLLIKFARGSPRRALSGLAQVRDTATKKEAAAILQVDTESEPVLELCRMLVDGKGSWGKAMALVSRLDQEPESVRINVVNYVSAVLIGTDAPRSAMHLCSILDAFSKPYNTSDRLAPLLLSIAEILLANQS